jgi:hypothetical protein|tara:strand:- start:55 stop:687 length:633 start_codon:yes stop_codon:yes gene_type:complete
MFDYAVIENFVPSNMSNTIKDKLLASNHWEYMDCTININKDSIDLADSNIRNTHQFMQLAYGENGPCSYVYSELAKPVLWMLEAKTGLNITSVQRIKANLLTPNGSTVEHYNPPHIDHTSDQYLSMVYYVNDSDGDTRIFDHTFNDGCYDMKMICSNTPKQGNAIIFPSTRFHCSSNPIDTSARVVLNMVFTVTSESLLQMHQVMEISTE